MAVLALRTESPWSRFVLAFPWWAFASARNFLASSMSCRVSGLTLPASAFLMVSSACLITTGQLYAKDAEPTRTSTAQRIAATTNLMHRHSSLIRRSLSRELHFFSTSGGPRAAAGRPPLPPGPPGRGGDPRNPPPQPAPGRPPQFLPPFPASPAPALARRAPPPPAR